MAAYVSISTLTQIAAHQLHLPALWTVIPASTETWLWNFSQAAFQSYKQEKAPKLGVTVPPICFNSWDLESFQETAYSLPFTGYHLSVVVLPVPSIWDIRWCTKHSQHSCYSNYTTGAPGLCCWDVSISNVICTFATKTFAKIPKSDSHTPRSQENSSKDYRTRQQHLHRINLNRDIIFPC